MKRLRVVLFVALTTTALLTGCNKKPNMDVSGWDTQDTTTTTSPDTVTNTTGPGTETGPETETTTTGSEATTTPTNPTVAPSSEDTAPTDYKSVDLTLGKSKSKLYTYAFTPNKGLTSEIKPSKTYDGFFDAKTSNGTTTLMTPDLKPVVYPKSAKYKVLDPFLSGNVLYFRVEDKKTKWKPMSEIYSDNWWKPLGGYAVVDVKGKEVIPFGRFDYIDQFVDGKARAYSVKDKNYYIIDVKGKVLKTYPVAGKVAPYKLYPDGIIFTRSDVKNKHSHALITWDGDVVIPYYVYKDYFHPKYIGDGTFLVNNDILVNGKKSGLILYSVDKDRRKLPKASYDVFSADDNKYVTGMITNGLAGPLAKWQYVVTDYAGKVLIKQGKYTFNLGGWGGGYAVARNKAKKLVLLDSNCKEVKMPKYMELTGRYSSDAALFTVKLTKDFKMWQFSDVPTRYDNPVGVVDKDFNWVIPPGMVDYIRNLPLSSVDSLAEYKQGDTTSSFIHIAPITTK